MIKLTQIGFNKLPEEAKWKSISQVSSQPKHFSTEEALTSGYSHMMKPQGRPSSVETAHNAACYFPLCSCNLRGTMKKTHTHF